jgi:hypothetical protein
MATKKKSKKRKKGHLFGKPSGEVVKHPGSLKKAAAKHGVSTKEEAEEESKSSDPKIRSRGNLGKRFLGVAKHGNIHKKGKKKGHSKRRITKR